MILSSDASPDSEFEGRSEEDKSILRRTESKKAVEKIPKALRDAGRTGGIDGFGVLRKPPQAKRKRVSFGSLTH